MPIPARKPVADKSPEINFYRIQDITYWAKKLEVSPHQLIGAYNAIHSKQVLKIERHLKKEMALYPLQEIWISR